jgi:hypothetical protein
MFQHGGAATGAGAGRGGVSRGRGDAPLTGQDRTPIDSASLGEARRLRPATVDDPEAMRLLGIGSTAPTASDAGEAAGLTDTGASSGQAAWRRRLAPRHRRAVGTFFGGGD